MEVRAGYKQTEVGVIPQEWEVKSLGSLSSSVASGRSSSKSTIGDFPVHGSTGVIGYTTHPEYEGAALLVARVGANAGRLNFVSGRYGVTDNTIMLRLTGAYDLAFVWRQLEAKRLNNLVFGSGQPLITGTQLKALPLALPSLPEQRAIAAALSDVDALLGGLDRLIVKKRDLKQAAMQQLLTGQTRLPGFSGEWEVMTLGDVVTKFVGGGTPSRANPAFWGNEIPWATVKDFATFNPSHTQEAITALGLQNSASHLIPAGTLITSTRMALGKAVVYEVNVAINQDLKALFLTSDTNVQFLVRWFEHFGRLVDDLGSGSTVKGISIADLRRLPFRAPLFPEQAAIVAVLSDMDAELAALVARRDKTRDLKQAMVQELLTGRSRLVEPTPHREAPC